MSCVSSLFHVLFTELVFTEPVTRSRVGTAYKRQQCLNNPSNLLTLLTVIITTRKTITPQHRNTELSPSHPFAFIHSRRNTIANLLIATVTLHSRRDLFATLLITHHGFLHLLPVRSRRNQHSAQRMPKQPRRTRPRPTSPQRARSRKDPASSEWLLPRHLQHLAQAQRHPQMPRVLHPKALAQEDHQAAREGPPHR